MSRWLSACAIVVALQSRSAIAAAEPRPNDAEITARIAFLERVIAREQASTRLWYDGWVGFFGAATLAQTGLAAAVHSHPGRIVGVAGIAKSGIAFTFMVVSPAIGRTASDMLRALPSATPSQRVDKLRRAEALLRRIATEERFRRSWFPAIGGAALNIGGAWAVWATVKNPTPGWIGLSSGVAVSLLHRFTQPTGAIRDLDAYTRGDYRPRPAVGLSVAPSPTGILVQGSF